MVHCFLNTTMFFAISILLLVSCNRNTVDKTQLNLDTDVEEVVPVESQSQKQDVSTNILNNTPFGLGTVSVFGLKIPTGMIPAKGPENVYRFLGKMSFEQTVFAIKRQIRVEQEIEEEQGILFRFAKPNTALSEKDNRVLAIRIFPANEEVNLDIWLEKEYQNKLPDKSSKAAFTASTIPKPVVYKDSKAAVQKSQSDRQETMRLLRKIDRGEPLTKQELSSGLLH